MSTTRIESGDEERLSYLHDAQLHGLQIDYADETRNLMFSATYHDDCGLSQVAGKSVEVRANDIRLICSKVFGAETGIETIDSIEFCVSDKTEVLQEKWIKLGCKEPGVRFTLKTHNGSVWEIMCESLSIELLS